VVTEWREFRELDLSALAGVMASAILVDGRNVFRPEAAMAAGFQYSGIGRPVTAQAVRRMAGALV
jgi:UDPglucose 6-dehydrogenase